MIECTATHCGLANKKKKGIGKGPGQNRKTKHTYDEVSYSMSLWRQDWGHSGDEEVKGMNNSLQLAQNVQQDLLTV